ncbi:hypothetical protein A3A36_02690 [Candidatus Kaiserbacteria bacterium RIFCSPLOWO2_01_FULL_52_12b]|uniref:Uncharacterized protein n=1 Tax=Candidatus Kaiserbacteria bacterium RIFCSPLOWO2_01_FULL_52_12b TaxID=1798509 RepID=A0A1F6EWQ2_9BACT|nr:MAG: hypothetical protein A3A36_02690 [Candidatus Kaiserbacteria bacterium RIFCSPLOWO2_01_FULL_52_12b]
MYFDWHTWLGTGASILLLTLIVPYIRSITRGTTRPSAVSWFGWALLFAIATAAQASKGVDWSLAIPLISTLSTTIIAFTALRLGRAVWTRADGICIVLGTLAIIFWAITKEPLTAIILSIIADFAVTLPTIIKTYQDSTSEPATLWVLYVVGIVLEIAATRDFTIYNLLFPVYTVLGSAVIALLAVRGRYTSIKSGV